MIERTPVKSSNISSIGHCPDTNTLAVEFKDGAVYHYHNFLKAAHSALLNAESIGSHFHQNIKNQYKYTKQDDK
jgi:KTSC domain